MIRSVTLYDMMRDVLYDMMRDVLYDMMGVILNDMIRVCNKLFDTIEVNMWCKLILIIWCCFIKLR